MKVTVTMKQQILSQNHLFYAQPFLSALLSAICFASLTFAQDLLTKGGISIRVTDATGAVLPNAKVIISGPTGERTLNVDAQGEAEAQNLLPGRYTVKAEQTGFKTLTVSDVDVFVGKIAALKLVLQAGNIAEVVEVVAGMATIDTASTAIGSNLNDQLYENLPLQRNVSALFYLTPGVTDSLAGGAANPSISGASALDNLYVADGVNITDASFGGLGVFSRVYGTLGLGINTSYIKEVQVKTGGFEPQFGQAQGGIVNIITKSGTNEYHGSVFGYARPNAFEAARLQPDDLRTNKSGKILANEQYDVGISIGGPVAPKLKDKLFFFGSFNPTINRNIVEAASGSGLRNLYGAQTHQRYFTKNYALKIDYNVTPAHQINFSLFGDPTLTNKASFRSLNSDNTTANSVLDFGTRNTAVRYNGSLSSSWTVSASFSQGRNRFDETGFDNVAEITDFTQEERGAFNAVGLGFYEPTDSTTYRATFDTQKQKSLWGSHTLGAGYQYQRAFYGGRRDRSGPRFTVPSTNASGINALTGAPYAVPAAAAGQSLNGSFQLFTAPDDCTLCPFLNIPGHGDARVMLVQTRGEFGSAAFETEAKYHAAYVQDTWRINRFVTALAGYRWEQERLIGSPGVTGERLNYTFTGNWSPRFGVTVDPTGKGKMKAYYNFGRFHEYIPLDLAERSLSTEKSFIGATYAPEFTIVNGQRRAVVNQYGTVNPVVSNANLLDLAAGGITDSHLFISLQDHDNPILPGTKLGFSQEHLFGFEMQLPKNLVFSARYIDRRSKRIVEDAAVVSPEGIFFFGQTYFIGNINSKLDAAVNPIAYKFAANGTPPAQCDPELVNPEVTNSAGQVVGGICYAALGKNGAHAGDPGADGVPDGFADPVRNYRAVELELNKRFSNNWQLLANWRIARLLGNYEGHLRNDNGQTDPAISSLFDFTGGEYGLLGDQFAIGPLNTDRRHIANIYANYAFGNKLTRRLNGLNFGFGVHLESGVPISEYLAHPAYQNAGEVPVGGRGKSGRTPFFGRLDLHTDYPIRFTERVSLKLIADFFNVTNNRGVRLPDQNRQITIGLENTDYGKPLIYYAPFNMRLGLQLNF
jgi:Carboxypeptidase regulatory-like domain